MKSPMLESGSYTVVPRVKEIASLLLCAMLGRKSSRFAWIFSRALSVYFVPCASFVCPCCVGQVGLAIQPLTDDVKLQSKCRGTIAKVKESSKPHVFKQKSFSWPWCMPCISAEFYLQLNQIPSCFNQWSCVMWLKLDVLLVAVEVLCMYVFKFPLLMFNASFSWESMCLCARAFMQFICQCNLIAFVWLSFCLFSPLLGRTSGYFYI